MSCMEKHFVDQISLIVRASNYHYFNSIRRFAFNSFPPRCYLVLDRVNSKGPVLSSLGGTGKGFKEE